MKDDLLQQIELRSTADGICLPIQAQPRSRTNAVKGVHAGRLKVAVTSPPEKGLANEAILKTLATALSLKPSQFHLAAGASTRQKTVVVCGITLEDLSRRLRSLYSSP